INIDDLRNIIALSDLPDEHLQWLADRMEYREFEDGEAVLKKGEAIDSLWLIAKGKFDFYMDVNGQQIFYYSFQNDNATGGVTGLIPYSRMKESPGYSYSIGRSNRYALHKKYFPELEQLNPEFVQRLIGYMTERAKSFATVKLQHEKVSALGKLSAGIAHEMNNPASAITRISFELSKRLKENYGLTEKLLESGISAQQLKNIRLIVEEKSAVKTNKISPLERVEMEDEFYDWFSKTGAGDANLPAESFIDAGFSCKDLDAIKNDSSNEAYLAVLQWIENLLSSQRIIKDLEEASTRISSLVMAIKSHVHMDQTNELQPTDVRIGIESTLTLLGYKLREKHINIKKTFSEDLPNVLALVGEMNQVWTNIIDNAIHAVTNGGEITVEANNDDENVTVKITDDGEGIAPEHLSRIFDPFFTTKKLGEGTGIGLDLVNRIIKNHNGKIFVESKPGRTEFKIVLPVHKK
ncbi:MAG: ATP-binding protein, partial [Ignavibacteria bacterium]